MGADSGTNGFELNL